LRLHSPVKAAADDVIPLSEPVCTVSGKMTEGISIAKGTFISVPICAINRSSAIWGPDAKQFKPDRWLITFGDGPRACLAQFN